jgi:putative DNA primase/helicase
MAGADFIRTVAAAALGRFDQVADWLGLASGKNQGREYLPLNPKRADTKAGSFTINRDSGAWSDFATGDKGGDLVSLCAYLHSIKQGAAADKLADFLGIEKPDGTKRPTRPATDGGKVKASPATVLPHGDAAAAGSADVCMMPIPADALAPPATHSRHGKPSRRWAYTTADGAVNFYHDRYEPKVEGERKQFAPLTLWRTPAGRLEWRYKAPTAPRPPYGLPSLTRPGAAVLTEGEKAADAAALLLPDHPVLTWQGGAQAVSKADFSTLRGREVWLWPDNDEAGEKAARDLLPALHAAGAGPIKRFDLGVFAQTASEEGGAAILTEGAPMATGDDAADLTARAWTAAHMALIVSRPDALIPCDPPPAIVGAGGTATPGPGIDTKRADAPAAGFRLTDKGVYHVKDEAERWICSPLAVVALVRDPQNAGWGLLTEFSDPDRNPHRIIVPMQLFRGDGAEVAGLLLDRGLKIAPRGRPLLIEYLQTARSNKRARITGRTGWHETTSAADGKPGAVFVLPNEAIGAGRDEWIFDSESPATTFTTRGAVKGWQQEVAALCRGNSRLLFTVSVAFAAPLLYLTGSEGGGFHLRGNSSDGKTTALRVAASVCGGRDYMQTWRNTDNALETTAQQHCDALLLLDEIAQVDARAAGECVYMLANGGAKGRAQRMGGLRARASWRVLFLSAGEIGLLEQMSEAGKSPRAGQDARLAELPADAGKGLGIFENLHGYQGGAEFSKALTDAARANYGGPFLAYLAELVKHQGSVADTVKEAQRKFQAACLTGEAHGQARRVADRFALVGAAGELATRWGLTGWEPGEAMTAARTCFEAWKARRGGEGNQEERAALAAVREFLRRYGESSFTEWDRPPNKDDHAPVRSDRSGYRKHDAAEDAGALLHLQRGMARPRLQGLRFGRRRALAGQAWLCRGRHRAGSPLAGPPDDPDRGPAACSAYPAGTARGR